MRELPDVSDMRVLEPFILRRQAAVVAALLDAGCALEARDEHGRTTLLRACSFRVASDLVKLLISRGANIYARDNTGGTALHVSPWQRTDTIRLLVNAGLSVDARDDQRRTPLHVAVEHPSGTHTTIETLLEFGADIEARTADGMTPLMIAASTLGEGGHDCSLLTHASCLSVCAHA